MHRIIALPDGVELGITDSGGGRIIYLNQSGICVFRARLRGTGAPIDPLDVVDTHARGTDLITTGGAVGAALLKLS